MNINYTINVILITLQHNLIFVCTALNNLVFCNVG